MKKRFQYKYSIFKSINIIVCLCVFFYLKFININSKQKIIIKYMLLDIYDLGLM